MIKNILAVLAAGFLLSACASPKMYRGPRLDRQYTASLRTMQAGDAVQLAKARGYAYDPGVKVRILRIDGKKAGSSKYIEVMPGYHDVDLCFSRSGHVTNYPVSWVAEAGKEYLAAGVQKTGQKAVFWIEEIPSRKVIAGARPRSFDPK